MSERRTYSEKLKDPRWQKRRLEILERDEWRCQGCADTTTTLHVHHRYYESGKEPWEYDDEALVTVCENCHEEERTGRSDIEDELLKYLRRTLLVSDLEALSNTLQGLPRYVLLTLAHTDSNPVQWTYLARYVYAEVADYAELCRKVQEEIAQEREPAS